MCVQRSRGLDTRCVTSRPTNHFAAVAGDPLGQAGADEADHRPHLVVRGRRLKERYALLWLLTGLGPVVLLAYLVLGLPRPGAPLQPPGRRLTGGWAFLLTLVLNGA